MGWTNLPVAAGSSVVAQVATNTAAAAAASAAAAAADAKAMAAQTMAAAAAASAAAPTNYLRDDAADTTTGNSLAIRPASGGATLRAEGDYADVILRDRDAASGAQSLRLLSNAGEYRIQGMDDAGSAPTSNIVRVQLSDGAMLLGGASGNFTGANTINAKGFFRDGTRVAGYVALGAALTVHSGNIDTAGVTLTVTGMPTTASAVHVAVERTGFSGSRDGLPMLAGPVDGSPLTTGGELPQLDANIATRLELTVRNNPGTNQFFIKTLQFFTAANVHVLGYWL